MATPKVGDHGAALPRVGLPRPAVVHQAEALAFRVFEVEHGAPVPFRDRAVRGAVFA